MIGKAAKVRRLATILAVGGKVDWTRANAALTSSRVRYISTFQEKKRSISAVPRLVTDHTYSSPGTVLTASSRGRVTVTSIWSMGNTPLSTPTTMRGKLVSGKTATGMVSARYTPTTTSVRITKIMDLPWRAVQCGASAPSVTGGGVERSL